jgi:hypothetical protein
MKLLSSCRTALLYYIKLKSSSGSRNVRLLSQCVFLALMTIHVLEPAKLIYAASTQDVNNEVLSFN